MSGWQRIGVVISVLWLLGLPLYLRIYNLVLNCDHARVADFCRTWSDVEPAGPYLSLSWGYLARLFRDNVEMSTGVLLGPIILLWLVGWIVLSTVRWIQRGFTGPGR
jgi:hypothetical protein